MYIMYLYVLVTKTNHQLILLTDPQRESLLEKYNTNET